MSGIFKYNSNAPQRPQSGPSSLSTPTRRHGLFFGSPIHQQQNQAVDASVDNGYTMGFRSPQSSYGNTSNPGGLSPSQGRSLREYEEQMTTLRKENFNLKLRIYFLEEKAGGTVGEGPDLYKANIDLKVEVESMRNDLQEKQDLLCQAAKAIELMDEQHKQEMDKLNLMLQENSLRIDEQTVEIRNLNQALSDRNTSHYHNDTTGFADFLTAVEPKDIQQQQEQMKMEMLIKNFGEQNELMCQKIEQLEYDKEDYARKLNELTFENSELKEALEEKAKTLDNSEKIETLEKRLLEEKVKNADVACELDDAQRDYTKERAKHLEARSLVFEMLDKIKVLRKKVQDLEAGEPVDNAQNDLPECTLSSLQNEFDRIHIEKDEEICKLKEELRKRTQDIQGLVNTELWEKNREIERLNKLINQQKLDASANMTGRDLNVSTSSNSFNETKFNEAVEKTRNAQRKINQLINQLFISTDKAAQKATTESLKFQLKELQRDNELCEENRRQCLSFCGILMERLDELAGFLNSLLNQKGVLTTLGLEQQKTIQKVVNKSLDMSKSFNHSLTSLISNQSLGNMSQLQGMSFMSFDDLHLTRHSMGANIPTDNAQIITNLRSEIDNLKQELHARRSTISIRSNKSLQKMVKKTVTSHTNIQSESEEWSDYDRDVSMARIGLKTEENLLKQSATTSDDDGDLINKINANTIQEKIASLEKTVAMKNDKILEIQCNLLDVENQAREQQLSHSRAFQVLEDEMSHATSVNQSLERELSDRKSKMEKIQNDLLEQENFTAKLKVDKDELNVELRVAKAKLEQQMFELKAIKDRHQTDIESLTAQENEKNLCLQFQMKMQKAEMEQQLKKLREEVEQLGNQKQELNLKISELEELNAKLQNSLLVAGDKPTSSDASGYASEEVGPIVKRSASISSSDEKENIQRLSNISAFSLDQSSLIRPHLKTLPISPARKSLLLSNDLPCENCKKLAEEAIVLRGSLGKALANIHQQNRRKALVENSIKVQIQKTHNVLQNVRSNMETELKKSPGKKEGNN